MKTVEEKKQEQTAAISCAIDYLEDAIQRTYLVQGAIESHCDKLRCENYFGKSLVLLDAIDSMHKAKKQLKEVEGSEEKKEGEAARVA